MTVKELIESLLEYPMDLEVAVETTRTDRCGDSYSDLDPVSHLSPRRMPTEEDGSVKSWRAYEAKADLKNPNILVIE